MAGVPSVNASLFHRLRFLVGDPTAVIDLPGDPRPTSWLILRDIEIERARQHARVDQVACPADFTPPGGLSGDRETATAQAAAECLRRAGIESVVADRSLPLIFSEVIREVGIQVVCDLEMGVLERRRKDEQEIEWLRESQRVTEGAMEMACHLVAKARPKSDGTLVWEGRPLTSERVRSAVDHWLLERAFYNPPCIVAGGPAGAACHELGRGALRTGEPVIIDIFPQCQKTRYCGDCTRTVVNGTIPEPVARMHATVVEAKRVAVAATRAGVTGEQVHRATSEVMIKQGYQMGLSPGDGPDSYCSMTHGTGHGIGLDVHEPPLLDFNAPQLVVGDALTIEPGLYRRDLGGIRVEDMVIVTEEGCLNLNRLPEHLDWS
jgi:Xaa-Pro aminopeptidase